MGICIVAVETGNALDLKVSHDAVVETLLETSGSLMALVFDAVRRRSPIGAGLDWDS